MRIKRAIQACRSVDIILWRNLPMRAADIGTTRVVQLNESSSPEEAACTMRHHDVGCIVVTRNTVVGALPSGIVTDRDLALRFRSHENGEEKPSLHDIESLPLATCRPDATIDELVDIMLGSHVRRLPIVDEEGMLIGIVTLDDVVTALAELLHRVSGAVNGTKAID
jgi:CBS domain-containing protein